MQINTLDTGMYIIDQNYTMLYCNQRTLELYPDIKTGEPCYKTLACRQSPCNICPLRSSTATFYNPTRKEWITSDASDISIPGHETCYCIHFHLKQRMNSGSNELISDEEALRYLMEADASITGDESILGGYCEEGFPLFYASEQLLNLLGYTSRDEFASAIGNMVINTMHPDDRQQMGDAIGDFEEGKTFETIHRLPHKDGTWIWTMDRGRIIRTMDGRLAILSCCTDMTSLIQRQSELLEQNQYFLKRDRLTNAMMENMPSGYHRCAARPGCPFLFIGDHFCNIVGWSRDEIERDFGNLFLNLIWPDDIGVMATYDNMLEMIGKGNSFDTSIYRMKRKGGGFRWVLDSTMFVDLGEDSFFQATLADITEFVEGKEEEQRKLEQAMAHIEKISRAKSSFLFNVSHDLRTPMNAIKGFTHMLSRRTEDAAYVREMVGKIEQSSDMLMQLLGDVLELSRIESGKDELTCTAMSVQTFCEKLYLMFVQEIEQAGITFSLETDLRDRCILADELKCTRIVMNMLSNARKFTPAGGNITLRCEQLPNEYPSEGIYRFTVQDTGIGMSREFLERAFDEFEREKSSSARDVSGSGLGLSIIRKLVTLMGGTCELDSKQGEGTTISALLRFPLLEESTCPCCATPSEKPDLAGKHILLAEDNAFNREIARFLLEDLGLNVTEAEDGRLALDALANAGPGHFDLILMDLQMPNMDGYTATAAIRALPDKALASLPIIAMTANAFAEDRERCIAVGMNDHLSKPIDPQALAGALTAWL